MKHNVKKHIHTAILLLFIVGVMFAYNTLRRGSPHAGSTDGPPAVAEYRKISADEAKQMLETSSSAILLDVRTDDEYKAQHIPGAVLIPDYEVSTRAEAELPDKDALILVYCRTGRRSNLAANELVGLGYTNVYDFGGIVDWPYDVE